MDREQARECINSNLEDYLERRGIDTGKNFKCLNPSHPDNSTSMSIDRSKGQPYHAKCSGCNAYYDTLALIKIDYGLTDPDDVFNQACDICNITPDNDSTPTSDQQASKPFTTTLKESSWVSRLGTKTLTTETPKKLQPQNTPDKNQETSLKDYLNKAHEQVGHTDYFLKQGLSRSTVEQFKLGYDPALKTKEGAEFVTWQAVIIPTGEYSFIAKNTDLSAEIHNRMRKRGPSTLYNLAALRSGSPVFIVEEEMDALSLIEIGAEAVALGESSNINQLIETLQKEAPAGGLVLCLENDEEVTPSTKEISSALKTLNIPFIHANIAGEYKGPSEALTMAREQFIQTVQATQASFTTQQEAQQRSKQEAYLTTSSAHHLQDFINGIKDSVNTPYIPTGFAMLDQLLDGGLYEGLYVLEGILASGKTSFMLQIADQIAQAGNDVLLFSLEIARTELIAKSISRLTFLGCNKTSLAKTAREITTAIRYPQYSPTEHDTIKAGMEKYGTYAPQIYISEGVGDIGVDQVRDIITRHINVTGNKPVIIIDYLQILAPYNPLSTDKQKLDKTVIELKRISRDYKTPVLALSSLNRTNIPVTMENFTGSETIANSSDVLICLQAKGAEGKDFDINLAANEAPRKMELKLLKNRNGAIGKVLFYDYYPMFNCFVEAKN